MKLKVDIKDILKRIVKGDKQAFEYLFDNYYDILVRYGVSYTSNKNVAFVQDVVQDLFVWIAKNPKNLVSVKKLDVYLFKCVRSNIDRKEIRDKKKASLQLSYVESIQDQEPSPEVQYVNDESATALKITIDKVLGDLPKVQKQVVLLRINSKMDYQKIGSVLGVSAQVARNYFYRAIKKIREHKLLQGVDIQSTL